MITLFGSGPRFGLPDASPFVTKAEVLLKMSGLPYRTEIGGFGKAPKGKIPYIDDDGVVLGDTTFIRFHLEERHGIDFDRGLTPAEKATAWAFEKLCEDHLYWALVHARWTDDANFARGPAAFFADVPRIARPAVVAMIRRRVRGDLRSHGLGRHTRGEIERLAIRDLEQIAAFLADKPWLMGDEPVGADAAVWAMVLGMLSPVAVTPIRDAGERMAALVAYRDRGLARWFPELATKT